MSLCIPSLDAFRTAFPPYSVTHLLYHAKCHDGLAAAWVTQLYSAKTKSRPIELVPVRAASTWFELCEACPAMLENPRAVRCVFVDVAPTLAVVHELRSRHIVFGVLDHHRSNERELAIPEAYYNMSRSGCVLSYFYFFGQVPDASVPWILLYLEDYDLFDWKRGRDSFLFHLAWMANVSPEPESVFPLLHRLCKRGHEADSYRTSQIRKGSVIKYFVENEASAVASDGKVMQVSFNQGRTFLLVLCANYTGKMLHDVAHELAHRSYDMVVFWRLSSRTRLYHSTLVTLRQRGIDVSAIASEVAAMVGGTGGGHALAAGMQTNVDPESLMRRMCVVVE